MPRKKKVAKKKPPMHKRQGGLMDPDKQWAMAACNPYVGSIAKGRTTTNKAKVTCLRCRRIIDAKAKAITKPKRKKRTPPPQWGW